MWTLNYTHFWVYETAWHKSIWILKIYNVHGRHTVFMRCQPILNCYYYISKNHVNQFVLCPIKFWTHEKQQWDLMCSSNWKIKYLNIQNITSSFSIQSGWNKLDLVVFLSSRLGLGWLFFVLTVHFLSSPDF